MMTLLFAGGGLTAIAPLILMIAAVIMFALAVFWRGAQPPTWNLVALGLLCWSAAVLIQLAGGL